MTKIERLEKIAETAVKQIYTEYPVLKLVFFEVRLKEIIYNALYTAEVTKKGK